MFSCAGKCPERSCSVSEASVGVLVRLGTNVVNTAAVAPRAAIVSDGAEGGRLLFMQRLRYGVEQLAKDG